MTEPAARSAAVDAAIRSRRTHKAYGPEPLPRAVLEEVLELARWAPNHHLSEPWRFRVLGPRTLQRLGEVAGPAEAVKLARAPTLVVASAVVGGEDPVADEEDRQATAAAIYAVLLGAHARGLATYWRTPALLRTPEGRAAVAVPDGEHVLGLLHLGEPRQEPRPPERAELGAYTTFLP